MWAIPQARSEWEIWAPACSCCGPCFKSVGRAASLRRCGGKLSWLALRLEVRRSRSTLGQKAHLRRSAASMPRRRCWPERVEMWAGRPSGRCGWLLGGHGGLPYLLSVIRARRNCAMPPTVLARAKTNLVQFLACSFDWLGSTFQALSMVRHQGVGLGGQIVVGRGSWACLRRRCRKAKGSWCLTKYAVAGLRRSVNDCLLMC